MPFRTCLSLLALLPLLLIQGCLDSSSGSNLVREVGLNVAGLYAGQNGANLVSNTSGDPVSQMNIRQSGSELTGIDNNGNIYRGNVTRVDGESAGFVMQGIASSGAEVTMNGAFNVSGDTSTMTGRWIEPAILASINGSSFVPGRSDDTDNTDDEEPTALVAVSPSGSQSLETGDNQVFTASGGNGSFEWTLSNNNIGSLNRSTGSSVTYTANAVGNQEITATSGDQTTTVAISQTAEEPETTALTVNPDREQTITVDDSITFTASGGDGSIRWSVTDSNIGRLSGMTGMSVTYTSTGTGAQTVTATSGGEVVTRRVIQEAAPTTSSLTIDPAGIGGTVLLGAGVSQTFTVSGGTAPYRWTLSNQNLGTLDRDEGISVTFTAGDTAGAPTLTVSDANSQTASVILGLAGSGNVTPPPTPGG